MDNAAYATGKWPKDKDHGPGPVKAACLSCRQKKAKCDGVKPVCGQVSCAPTTHGAGKRAGNADGAGGEGGHEAVRTREKGDCGRVVEGGKSRPRPNRG